MLHNLRHYIVILTLFALLFGAGGKVVLCLSPHGNVHMKQDHSSCELVKKCPQHADEATPSHHRVKCQSHHRDISLGVDLLEPPNKNTIQLPPPSLISLGGSSIIFALTDKEPFYTTPAVILPQLVLQQSVILLI
jgi:hypothetical protein